MTRPAGRAGRRRDRAAQRVALVHDWLTGMRGGEKVLDAHLRALSRTRRSTRWCRCRARSRRGSRRAPIRTSFVQRLPDAGPLLPPLPAALSAGGRAVRPRRLRPGHQQQPLRGEVGRWRPAAPCTSATATRRCATPGISSTPTSARLRSAPLASRLLRPVMARLARWDRGHRGPRGPLSRELSICCGQDPPIL